MAAVAHAEAYEGVKTTASVLYSQPPPSHHSPVRLSTSVSVKPLCGTVLYIYLENGLFLLVPAYVGIQGGKCGAEILVFGIVRT
jgi:hypothetical protein